MTAVYLTPAGKTVKEVAFASTQLPPPTTRQQSHVSGSPKKRSRPERSGLYGAAACSRGGLDCRSDHSD